jgi:hypothetical protein
LGGKICVDIFLYKKDFYWRLYATRKAVLPRHDPILLNISKFMFDKFFKKLDDITHVTCPSQRILLFEFAIILYDFF